MLVVVLYSQFQPRNKAVEMLSREIYSLSGNTPVGHPRPKIIFLFLLGPMQGLWPQKPHFSSKNPKLNRRCTFFPLNPRTPHFFFCKISFSFQKISGEIFSSTTLLPPAELHHFSGKTDLSKSSLSVLVLYLVILVVKRGFSMYSFEDCPP